LDKVDGGGKCLSVLVKKEQIDPFLEQYKVALSKLKELISQEKMGKPVVTNKKPQQQQQQQQQQSTPQKQPSPQKQQQTLQKQ